MYPPRLLRTRISSDSGRCPCRHSDQDFAGSMQALRKNARNSSGGNRPVSSVYSDLYRHCVKSVLHQDALRRMCQERNCGDDMLGYGDRSAAAISLEKTAGRAERQISGCGGICQAQCPRDHGVAYGPGGLCSRICRKISAKNREDTDAEPCESDKYASARFQLK